MYYFIADTHFDETQDRMKLYGREIFFNSPEECDDFIIKQWNKTVKPEDTVFHIGDVAMSEKGLEKMKLLNGNKILIKGNYDTKETGKFDVTDELLKQYFDKVLSYIILEIPLLDGTTEKVYVVHKPENGVVDLFNIVGHIHKCWVNQRNMLNVGCDSWHYTPVSLEQVQFQINAIRKFYDINVFAGELSANKLKN